MTYTLIDYIPSIFKGAYLTITLTLCSIFFSLLLGILAALGKQSKVRSLRIVITTYTTVIRGIPDIVLMLIIFYGGQVLMNKLLESFGYDGYFEISPFIAGVTTLSFIYGAYMAESMRGGILAIEKGQLEAGEAFAMTKSTLFFRITFPQMIRNALPSIGNNIIILLKTTALVSIIGLNDMVRRADIAGKAIRKPFETIFLVALLYLAMSLVLVYIFSLLKKRYLFHE